MKVKNGVRYEKNGWIYLSVKGTAAERGYAHGYMVAKELREIIQMLEYSTYESTGHQYSMFREIIFELYGAKIRENFPEYFEEMQGIAKGANANGGKLTLADIVFWNCYTSFDSIFGALPDLVRKTPSLNDKYGDIIGSLGGTGRGEGGGRQKVGAQDHCTVFIAVGSYTKDGKIVMGHNTFDNFISGQYFNVVLDIKPTKGHRMLMQAAPGYISSQTDVYVTEAGLMCTENTIGGFHAFEFADPICCRIRQAMQYCNTLDQVVDTLLKNNGGDYANTWVIGDTKTNTIMRFELGLKYHKVDKTKDGYFIGFNAPYDPRIRNLECSNTGWDDLRRHQGARRVRLEELMELHKGKIDLALGHEIMADHYDPYLQKINPCSRTNCAHYELDAREYMSDPGRPKPFQPRGALDGIVCDTTLTKNMAFSARWGASCGLPFDAKEFGKKQLIWKEVAGYLHDRPTQPWTEFTIHPWTKEVNMTKRKERSIVKMKLTRKAKKVVSA
jgi:hypothetical protein